MKRQDGCVTYAHVNHEVLLFARKSVLLDAKCVLFRGQLHFVTRKRLSDGKENTESEVRARIKSQRGRE